MKLNLLRKLFLQKIESGRTWKNASRLLEKICEIPSEKRGREREILYWNDTVVQRLKEKKAAYRSGIRLEWRKTEGVAMTSIIYILLTLKNHLVSQFLQ